MTIGIYKISATNGECFIEQSVNIEKRFAKQMADLAAGKGQKQLQELYDRVGPTGLSLSILEEFPNEKRGSETLACREYYWLKQTPGSIGRRTDAPRGSTIDDILGIREMLKNGSSRSEVAKVFDISYTEVAFIDNGTRHSHIK